MADLHHSAATTPQPVLVHPAEHPEAHEHSDISIKAIFWTFAIFIVAAILIHLGLWGLFKLYDAQQRKLDVPESAVTPAIIPTDRPPLQGVPGFHPNSPARDMAEMKQQIETQLNSQGPLPDGGYHIRIQHAMDLVLQQKLLKSATQPASATQSAHNQERSQ